MYAVAVLKFVLDQILFPKTPAMIEIAFEIIGALDLENVERDRLRSPRPRS